MPSYRKKQGATPGKRGQDDGIERDITLLLARIDAILDGAKKEVEEAIKVEAVTEFSVGMQGQ